MQLLTIDFESFYGKGYTLSSMTTEQYVRDPRFKAHLCGFKMNDKPAFWVPGHLLPQAFAKVDWANTAVLCHHAHFDCAILSWRYGILPALYLDTLSMARALFPAESIRLADLPKLLGFPGAKGDYLINTRDKQTLTPWELKNLGNYCAGPGGDIDLTYSAFQKMKGQFPLSEIKLIDTIIRLYTDPILELNPDLLQEAWHDERMATLALFKKAMPHLAHEAELAIEHGDEAAWKKLKTPLSSNPKFAAMLMELGVDPPKKVSPAALKAGRIDMETAGLPPEGLILTATKKEKERIFAETGDYHESEIWAYAFGKSDEGFTELLSHDDPAVPILVEARLGVKSTIKETRAQRFIGIASRGKFPIPLLYYGGHTGRLSGGDKINAQNLNKFCPAPWCDGGKVDQDKLRSLHLAGEMRDLPAMGTEECSKCHGTGVSPLRRAIMAPPGHVIVVRDLSGIEARVLAWLAEQDDLVQAFASEEDVYCLTASDIFGRLVTKKDKLGRTLGKCTVLGCGYGLGAWKFQSMLRVGMLGNPSIMLGSEIAAALDVNLHGFLHRYSGKVEDSIPPGVDFDTHALHCACADKIIRAFRDNKPKIPQFWEQCQQALGSIMRGEEVLLGRNGVVRTCAEGILLPNGMKIRYTELEAKQKGRRMEYSILKKRRKGERGKVYGGLVTENIVQALARIILTDAFLEMRKQGLRPVHQVHDEILAVCREEDAEEVYLRMGRIMQTAPKWATGLPLASEGGWDRVYIK
jgi:hypothetical protein